LVHAMALATPFITGFTWGGVAWAAGMYALVMFGITAGYHRYFAHRSYKASRPVQFVLALIGTMAVQKGVLWWAAHHRHHHKFSDQPEDLHSPVQDGFWWSHVGWILSSAYDRTAYERIKDFAKYPELRWLNENYLWVNLAQAVVLALVGGW